MEAERFNRLVAIMQQMAAGDQAGLFALHREFGGSIAGVLKRQAARMGADLTREELGELVLDACLALFERAAAWRPDGGALPWTWGERLLARLVACHVGQHADPLPDDGGDGPGPMPVQAPGLLGEEPEVLTLLAALGDSHPLCRLLAQALELVTSERNRRILLEVKVQASLGDPSPAVTVARSHGLSHDNVRQVVKRTRDRLRRLAADDERFAALADLWLLAS